MGRPVPSRHQDGRPLGEGPRCRQALRTETGLERRHQGRPWLSYVRCLNPGRPVTSMDGIVIRRHCENFGLVLAEAMIREVRHVSQIDTLNEAKGPHFRREDARPGDVKCASPIPQTADRAIE
jgi:hypothetical protein